MFHASTATLLEVSAAVGAALPVAVAVVKQQKWSSRVKSFVGLGLCAGAAALTAWLTGKLNGLHPAEAFAVIYGATQASFEGVYKPTGADDWLARIGFLLPSAPPPAPPAASTK